MAWGVYNLKIVVADLATRSQLLCSIFLNIINFKLLLFNEAGTQTYLYHCELWNALTPDHS